MCDDIEATMDELRNEGIEFRGGPEDVGFGIEATMVLPGGMELGIYQPRHPTAV